jgi:hypothetical protein
MKAHLVWIRCVAVAVIAVLQGMKTAEAQYEPYRPQQTAPAPAATQPVDVNWYQTQHQAWQPAATAVAPYQPSQPTAVGPYPQTAAPYVPTASAPAQATYPATSSINAQPQPTQAASGATSYPQTTYPTSYPQVATQYPAGYPSYPRVAARQPNEVLPTPEQRTPSGSPNGTANGQHGQSTHGGVGQNGSMNGYPSGYPTGAYPSTANCSPEYGMHGFVENPCYETQWFGGVYFLFMERDRPSPVKLTVQVDHSVAPDPYYPPETATVLVTPDHDFREGVEVRFGSTFNVGGWYDDHWGDIGPTRRCGPCVPQLWAWEFGWWAINDDENRTTVVEWPGLRLYGMVNFVGLEYNGGGTGTWGSVNNNYGYGLPIADPGAPPYADGDVRVLAQRVRNNFDAQNFELNIFRIPVCQIGCDPAACYGGGACDVECCRSGFSMFGSCGVRYFRADEEFQYATEFTTWTGGAGGGWDQGAYNGFTYDNPNELFYDIEVENHLAGVQLGWLMNYCYCKWNFFLHSTFGIFNNHINHSQRMWTGGDFDVRFAGTGETFVVNSDKDDVAFLGELRVGGSYDITCNLRAMLAYRAVAITGIANATDQIPDDFSNRDWVALIDSDNSLIVHGLQAGAEFRY